MKEGRPSTTAAWVAAWRGIGSLARPAIVEDRVAERIVPPAYAAILRVARSAPTTVAAVHRVADFVSAGRSRHLYFRTRAIDEGIAAAVAKGTRQLVIVGAGLDARAFRLDVLQGSVVFEVDHPSTQAYKRARVADVPKIARDVRFLATDFERDDLETRLAEIGHDRTAPTVFVWEGVTMYLSSDAIERVLRGLAAAGARGSTLLATYFEPQKSPFAQALRGLVRGVGEPVRSTFTPTSIGERLARHGWDVMLDEGDPEWSPRWAGVPQTWSLERLATASRR